jgi:serine/threonine-protein kinase
MALSSDVRLWIEGRVGATVRGHYRLDRLLGVGGTSAVYAATHRDGRRVALKMLHPQFAKYADVRERFLREGRIANRIVHAGITRVLEDGVDDGGATVFLVLELLDGETVEERRCASGGRLPLAAAIDVGDRLLDVLAAAHDARIVHRDLKPANLFTTTGGELKVLDFGIARLLEDTGKTESGKRIGTPAFMSPEQASGRIREIGPRSDLWSVGAVLFVLLSGYEVHPGTTRTEKELYAATQRARPIESVVSWVSRGLAAVVDRALAFEPDARWQSARQMHAALRAAAGIEDGRGEVPDRRRAAAPRRRRA